MTRRLVVLSCAAADILTAAGWYGQRRSGLSDDFSLCVEEAIERIVSNPLAYAEVGSGFRRALVRRFPYAVYFRVLEKEIKVYGVFHMRRHPTLWQRRN